MFTIVQLSDLHCGTQFFLPNLLGSPHNSGVTDGALQVGARMAAENVRRFLSGEAVIGVACREDYL